MASPRQPLVYLDAAQVEAALPPIGEQLKLARRTMIALVADADLPPKSPCIRVRMARSRTPCRPCCVVRRETARKTFWGIKWVLGFPRNRDAGLPAIVATILLNDPLTGVPRAALDGGPITARRTAAISGVAIQAWGPPPGRGTVHVAVIGAGVQARSHLAVLAEILPGADLAIADVHLDRAEAIAQEARESGRFAHARASTRSVDAPDGADIVLGLVSFGAQRQAIPLEAFAPDALVVAVDYDMSVPAALADEAGLFVVDERGQFLANRSTGIFAGYPDPAQTIGEALLAGTPPPAHGRTLVTHLGVGLADLIFADAVLRRSAGPA